jgi:hypothetical protein
MMAVVMVYLALATSKYEEQVEASRLQGWQKMSKQSGSISCCCLAIHD